jgi:type I restriction enzyme S subunit
MHKLIKIPKGWTINKVPEVLFFQEGPGVRKWQFRDAGVKLLNVGNINNQEIDLSTTKIHLSENEAYGKYKHFLVEDGDLLIACSGIVVSNFHNKIAFAKSENLPLSLNTSTMRFKVLKNNLIDLNYFRYYLQTKYFTDQLQKLITGSAQLNFGPSHIKKIDVLLPPLPEQKKIAAILDAADKNRQLNKALIAKYDELTQSLFLDMFGDVKINPNNFPKAFLSDVCNKITDGEHGTVERKSNGKLYLMARNIRENYIDLSDVSFISDEDHQRIYKRCKAEKGDILLVCVGATIGRLCITPEMEEFSLARSVALLKPKKEIVESSFLYSVLNSKHIQDVIKRSGNSSAQAGLYTGKIKVMEIYLPPLSLQNQFAERVLTIEAQKAQAQASLSKAEELFNSLLQKAFKGELS